MLLFLHNVDAAYFVIKLGKPRKAMLNIDLRDSLVFYVKKAKPIWYDTIRYDTIRYDTIRYDTIQYNTIQYNAIQYNAIQYNTIQYNTIQYNTIQCNDQHVFCVLQTTRVPSTALKTCIRRSTWTCPSSVNPRPTPACPNTANRPVCWCH